MSGKKRRLPRAKHHGTVDEVQDRAKERAVVMAERYPGVKFSLYVPNMLGVREGKRVRMPGMGLPQAIYNLDAEPVRDKIVKAKVLEAYRKWRSPLGYVSYTHLQVATGLSYAQVFGVFKAMYEDDPYQVRFNINRVGDNVYIKVVEQRSRL